MLPVVSCSFNWLKCSKVCLLLVFASCPLALGQTTSEKNLFVDDFESGLKKWEISNRRAIRVVNSDDAKHGKVLVLTPADAKLCALIRGSERWSGYRIEADFLFPTNEHNYLGFVYHLQENKRRVDLGSIYIKGNGNYIRVNPRRDWNPARCLYEEYTTKLSGQDAIRVGVWQRFAAEVINNRCHFYVGDMKTPKVTFDLFENRSGKAGFKPRVVGGPVWIDNVRVTAIKKMSYSGPTLPSHIRHDPDRFITEWSVLGPLTRTFSEVESAPQPTDITVSDDNRKRRWQKFDTDARGAVVTGKVTEFLGSRTVAYFSTNVEVRADEQAALEFSAIDDLTIWVNGKFRSYEYGDYFAWHDFDKNAKHWGTGSRIVLNPGSNCVLVRVRGGRYAKGGFFAKVVRGKTKTTPPFQSVTNPEQVGLSTARIARIKKMMQSHIDRKELAGAVYTIARRGKVVAFESLGQSDIASKKPMQDDAIFRLASMTKIVTTVAAMMLYEEGKFSLNDPISKYILEFDDMRVATNRKTGDGAISTVPAARKITILDLMRHTAGLTYASGDHPVDRLYRQSGIRAWPGTLSKFSKTLSEFPLKNHPGDVWEYSVATDLLGHLVEVISKESLDKFFAKRIFMPLKMNDTGFVVPADKLDRLTSVYQFKDGRLRLLESAANSPLRRRPPNFSGGGGWAELGSDGGLVSTASDYLMLLQLLLNKGALGDQRLLSRKSVELMMVDHLGGKRTPLGPGVGFGLGFAVLTDVGARGELGSKGQVWWAGSDNTYFWIDPQEEMIGVLMVQVRPFRHLNLMDRFHRLALQSIVD